MIDSLNNIRSHLKLENEGQIKLVTSISEGSIKNNKGVVNGGFSKETTTSPDGDTVYLIRYHDNLEKNLTQSYYFKHRKLVFSNVELQELKMNGAILFQRQEYYKNDKVVFAATSKKKLKKKYEWRTNFNSLTNGYFYLNESK